MTVWSLVVLLAAVLYLMMTLFGGIESPWFGIAIVMLMARELAFSRLAVKVATVSAHRFRTG